MKNLFAIAMALGFAVGCGGGDDDTLLRDVTLDEAKDLCEFANDQIPEEQTCGDGTMVGGEAPEDCDAITQADLDADELPATCDVTVGEYKDCIEALGDDPCADSLPAACAGFFSEDCFEIDEGRVRSLNTLRAFANQSRI